MTTPTTDINLGPLTSTFTAPSACNSITVSVAGSTYAPYVYPRLFSSIAYSCFPSGYPLGNAAVSTTFAPYDYQDQHVYYSPGICPLGWGLNTAGTSGTETTAFCCPPGFVQQSTPAVAGGGLSTYCTSSVKSTVVTTVAYTGDGAVDGSTQTFTFTADVIPMGAVWIRYKSGDFASTTSSGSSSTSFTTSTQTSSSTSSTSSAAPSGSSTPAVTASGLSTGGKIGLGVGVPFVALVALSIFAIFFIRRRKQKGAVAPPGNEGGDIRPEYMKAELPAISVEPLNVIPANNSNINTTVGRSEMDGQWPQPNTGAGGVQGGDGGHAHELSGSSLER